MGIKISSAKGHSGKIKNNADKKAKHFSWRLSFPKKVDVKEIARGDVYILDYRMRKMDTHFEYNYGKNYIQMQPKDEYEKNEDYFFVVNKYNHNGKTKNMCIGFKLQLGDVIKTYDAKESVGKLIIAKQRANIGSQENRGANQHALPWADILTQVKKNIADIKLNLLTKIEGADIVPDFKKSIYEIKSVIRGYVPPLKNFGHKTIKVVLGYAENNSAAPILVTVKNNAGKKRLIIFMAILFSFIGVLSSGAIYDSFFSKAVYRSQYPFTSHEMRDVIEPISTGARDFQTFSFQVGDRVHSLQSFDLGVHMQDYYAKKYGGSFDDFVSEMYTTRWGWLIVSSSDKAVFLDVLEGGLNSGLSNITLPSPMTGVQAKAIINSSGKIDISFNVVPEKSGAFNSIGCSPAKTNSYGHGLLHENFDVRIVRE